MTGRVAVHAALTPRQRAELDARAAGIALPRVRCPRLAFAIQRLVNGRGAAGPYLGGHLHTWLLHNRLTADAKDRARAALRESAGAVTLLTPEEMAARLELDDGRQHDTTRR